MTGPGPTTTTSPKRSGCGRPCAPWINPPLPEELRCLRIRLRFRGQTIELQISHDLVRVRAISPRTGAIRLRVDSDVVSLKTGETLEIKPERRPVIVLGP